MTWLSGYNYRRKITIDSTNVDSDLSHFPVPVPLGTSVGISDADVSGIFDEVGSDYLKIAVTSSDGETQLYVEVEQWDDTGEKALLWVSKSGWEITSASDTDIYIYYDSAADNNTTYVGLPGSRTEVWDSNYDLFWGFAQDPTDATGAILDSTANGNDGTTHGSMTSADLIDGPIGKAIDFDGSDDYISFSITKSGDFNIDFSYLRNDSSVNWSVFLGQNVSGDAYQGFAVGNASGAMRFYYDFNTGGNAIGAGSVATTLAIGTWYRFSVRRVGSAITIVKDGTTILTDTCDTEDLSLTVLGFRPTYGERHAFKMADLSIANNRADAWIKADYHAQTDNLITWGAGETVLIEETANVTDAFSSSGPKTEEEAAAVTDIFTPTAASTQDEAASAEDSFSPTVSSTQEESAAVSDSFSPYHEGTREAIESATANDEFSALSQGATEDEVSVEDAFTGSTAAVAGTETTVIKSQWTFYFTGLSLAYSTIAGIIGYTRKILNFSGINIHNDLTSGAIPSVEASFEIEDSAHELSVTDYMDELLTITITTDDATMFSPPTIYRQWTLKITSAVYSYGTIKIKCESVLGGFKDGKFPPYPSIKAIAPEVNEIDEDLCVPYIIGRAYIPIYPILTSGVRRYLLGKTADVTGDFTIYKVRSPRDYPSTSYWDSSYTYNQSNKSLGGTQCKITDMIIAKSEPGGSVDSNGIFQSGGKLMSPLVDYEGDVTSKHPGAFILDVLEKAGITICDDDSFTDADTTYFQYVDWAGGWRKYENLEQLISRLLSQCDSYLTFDDEVHFNVFDSASVETFNKSMIIEDSFTISAIRKPEYDGGMVRWRWEGEPQDVLTAEHPVRFASADMDSGDLPVNPDTNAFKYEFGYGCNDYDTFHLRFGILHFQKKHGKTAQVSFTTKIDKITNKNTLAPGQVIVFDDSSTGSTVAYDPLTILIYEIQINPDLTVDISGYAYNELEDYPIVSSYAVYPEGETDTDVPVGGGDSEGDPGTLSCIDTELYDVYSITPTKSGAYLTKDEAKTAAAALWRSLGDDVKWEPWDGEAVTTNHTWTGDTADFAIDTESLTATLAAEDSQAISLATLEIHAESLRINSTITIIGTSANTYCRIKLTDSDLTVRYLYLGVGNSGTWVDDTDKFLVGDGELELVLDDYGLVETITDISIECAVAAGDTSLEIEIGYIDFEYRHELLEECGSCYEAPDP